MIAPEFLHIEPISARSSRYGWTIRPHTHPGIFQFILLERGTGRLTADGIDADLRPTAFAAIPSGSIHAFVFDADAEGWVLSVASALFTELVAGNRPPVRELGAMHTPGVALAVPQRQARRMSWLLREFADDFAERGGGHLPASMTAALVLLIALGAEILGSAMRPRNPPAGTDARREDLAQRFRTLVDQHFRDAWPVPRYARELAASTPSLCRACQVALGRSPGDIILDRIHLEAMRSLTYTAAGVSRIADDLGFADPAYFSRFFKARSGMTPSRFRAGRAWLERPD